MPIESALYLNVTKAKPAFHEVPVGRIGVFSAPAPDGNGANEDSAAMIHVDETRVVLAIADGVGGARGGSQASALAIKALKAAIVRGAREEKGLRASILDGFDEANRAVREMSLGAATTLSVVGIRDNKVRPYHVGDSAILLVGQRGKLKMEAVAHSPVGYAVRSELLDELDAMEHESRNLVSNIVGDAEMHVEVGSPRVMSKRDTVILGSDGLTDNLHTDEIIQLIRRGALESVVDRLAEAVSQRMTQPTEGHPSKPDDLTFIVYRPKTGGP